MPDRDLRKYAKSTTLRLVFGGLGLLLVVGVGLIAWRFGTGAAAMGLVCILGGLVVVGVIVLLVFGLDFILKKTNKE